MSIINKNKKVKQDTPLLLGHRLKDPLEEALISKLNDIFLQVIPYNISGEDKELLRKNKTKESKLKIFKKYLNLSFYKVFIPRNKTKRVADYLLKLYKFNQDGGIRFTKEDSDGIVRDYYGFPLTMGIEKRQAFVSGPSNRDDYAKSIGLNSKIDQRTRSKNKKTREEDKVLIRKKYNELRANKPRELKVDKLLLEIQDSIKIGKIHYPSNKKNKFPTISTLRKIVNS